MCIRDRLYSDAVIEHHSIKKEYSDRNLRIYERMIEEGEELEPRHQFYYGRELYYHGRNEDAVRVFETFLRDREKGAWLENLVDACRFCALCFYRMGKREEALEKLFWTFSYDVPRPQICLLYTSPLQAPVFTRRQSGSWMNWGRNVSVSFWWMMRQNIIITVILNA